MKIGLAIFCAAVALAAAAYLRPEYRHDASDKTSFDIVNGSATTKSQDTLALGVMYRS